MNLCDKRNAVPACLERLQEEGNDVILYGAGYCGHETIALMQEYGIPICSVCDDFRAGEMLDGYEIIRMEDAQPSENTVIFITSGYNSKMKERLEKLGFLPYYNEIDFGRYDAEKENPAYFKAHEQELSKVWALLSDARSRHVLERLVNYRISRDIAYLDGLEESNQYFPPKDEIPLLCGDEEVFLDLGAYEGDTLSAFIQYVGGRYKEIIAVEASRRNYEMLLKNTEKIPRVKCINIGIYKEKAKLRFEVSDAKNSFASKEGDTILDVDTVDSILFGGGGG